MRPRITALALTLLLLVAGPASACLWDRDTDRLEQEFRSAYREVPAAPEASPSSAETGPDLGPIVMLGGGSALLLGAGGLCFRRQRITA